MFPRTVNAASQAELYLNGGGNIERRKINGHDLPDADKLPDVDKFGVAATASSRGRERRAKARIRTPFPATVRGISTDGEAFESETYLNELSASGLHLNLKPPVMEGSKLFVVIWFAPAPKPGVPTPRVAVRGKVVRVEKGPAGAQGVAVAITNYRFL